jgi:hypothetical protein
MLTRELTKGQRVRLRNGWEAEMVTVRGNTPTAKVYGDYTETGSVYAHDIVAAKAGDVWVPVQHTKDQLKLAVAARNFGF